MKKYRLVKQYPGSPELGTICEERNNKSKFCYFYENERNIAITKDQVENQPEYWEEITDIYYMVSLIDMGFHNAWEPIRVETIKYDTDTKKYFSTEEGARDFIIQHKPCLSFNDIRDILDKFQSDAIINDIKSRI